MVVEDEWLYYVASNGDSLDDIEEIIEKYKGKSWKDLGWYHLIEIDTREVVKEAVEHLKVPGKDKSIWEVFDEAKEPQVIAVIQWE